MIDGGKAPELAEILRIGSQAASALAAAHAQGLIHRDIKPANILLENGVERVKITDFGLARAVDDATMTQSGVVAGTPQYMSPEQARGEAIDLRTDLFSLGSVLYALCTGTAPFRGNSSMATLKRVCEDTPKSIHSLNPDIPLWLVKIIDKLHAKDPADRYGSAAEVADLLGRCLAHVQQPADVPLPAELTPGTQPPGDRALGCDTGLSAACGAGVFPRRSRGRRASGQLRCHGAAAQDARGHPDHRERRSRHRDQARRFGSGRHRSRREGIAAVGRQPQREGRQGRQDPPRRAGHDQPGRADGAVGAARAEAEPTGQLPFSRARSERSSDRFRRRVRSGGAIAAPEITKSSGSRPLVVLDSIGSEVRSVCFSPDGQILAYGTKSGRIAVRHWQWKIGGATGAEMFEEFDAHPGGVESVAFSPDGKTLASGGWDHHVKLWDITSKPGSPRQVWDFPGFSDGVRSVAFSPDGRELAAGGFDKLLIVLDAKTGLRSWTSPTLEQPVNGVQFSPDGRSLALAMGDYSKGTPGNPVGQPGEVQVWKWPGSEANRHASRLEARVQVGRVQPRWQSSGRHQRRRHRRDCTSSIRTP